MFEVWMQYSESPEVVCESREVAQSYVDGMTAIVSARSIATGGEGVRPDHFYIVEVVPMTAEQVLAELARESQELLEEYGVSA